MNNSKKNHLTIAIHNVSCITQEGVFQIFLINKRYILCKNTKSIFSSKSREVAQRNFKEWRYYHELENKEKETLSPFLKPKQSQ